jgi:hypothetical protein
MCAIRAMLPEIIVWDWIAIPRRAKKQLLFRENSSEKMSKLVDSQARVANNSAHCESVDWIMPRNGEDSVTIGHDNVPALAENRNPARSSVRTASR